MDVYLDALRPGDRVRYCGVLLTVVEVRDGCPVFRYDDGNIVQPDWLHTNQTTKEN